MLQFDGNKVSVSWLLFNEIVRMRVLGVQFENRKIRQTILTCQRCQNRFQRFFSCTPISSKGKYQSNNSQSKRAVCLSKIQIKCKYLKSAQWINTLYYMVMISTASRNVKLKTSIPLAPIMAWSSCARWDIFVTSISTSRRHTTELYDTCKTLQYS